MKTLLLIFCLIASCLTNLRAQDCDSLLKKQVAEPAIQLFSPWRFYNSAIKYHDSGRFQPAKHGADQVYTHIYEGKGIGMTMTEPQTDSYDGSIWGFIPRLYDSVICITAYHILTPRDKIISSWPIGVVIKRARYTFRFTDSSTYMYTDPYIHGNHFDEMFVLLDGTIPALQLDDKGSYVKDTIAAGDTKLLQMLMKKPLASIEKLEWMDEVFNVSDDYTKKYYYEPVLVPIPYEEATKLMQQLNCIAELRETLQQNR